MEGPGEDHGTVKAFIGDGVFPGLREEEGAWGELSVK